MSKGGGEDGVARGRGLGGGGAGANSLACKVAKPRVVLQLCRTRTRSPLSMAACLPHPQIEEAGTRATALRDGAARAAADVCLTYRLKNGQVGRILPGAVVATFYVR